MADSYKPPVEPTLPDLYQKTLIAGIYYEGEYRVFSIPFEALARYELTPESPGSFYENLRNISNPDEAVAILRDAWMRADGG